MRQGGDMGRVAVETLLWPMRIIAETAGGGR